MSDHLEWPEIALRLALAFAAGFLIGLDRAEHGRPAGMRTTLLVCLAATIAMIEANLLLPTANGQSGSIARFDVMRIPLGILTGVGFIGAGAILRHEGAVRGLTTAATLWFVTLVGLCFGAGQIGLGLCALALALIILWGLKWLEARMHQDRSATVALTLETIEPTDDEIRANLALAGLRTIASGVTYGDHAHSRVLRLTVQWRALPGYCACPDAVSELARLPGVRKLRWQPDNAPTPLKASGISL
jgi:putative Mg2+ transporter-C (MgtC) family protein